ncbi:MAG: nucleotidyltransferase family protein [Chloroflexota bacterium]|nr:nucleotidyltransferase family protein [Chloroflexota bacterium]
MDAVVTAGGIPKPEDALYPYTQGKLKALVDVAGKPMIQWVLDALGASKTVDQVVIVGLDSDSVIECSKPMIFLDNHGGMLDNVRAGIDKISAINPQAELVLMVSSDIPAVTAEIVDWTVESALESEHDLYYNLITRQVMESRYPGSNRSFIRMKDADVCGADMNVIRCSAAAGNDELWANLIAARKNVFKQAALVGYGTLFLLLTRQLSLEAAVRRGSHGLGLRGRAILCPHPEIGMDVDKPYQLEILRHDLGANAAA